MAAGRAYAEEVLSRAGGAGIGKIGGGPSAITVDQWIGFTVMCLNCIALVILAIVLPKDILGAQNASIQGLSRWMYRKYQWFRA